jgi:hypothetical protein
VRLLVEVASRLADAVRRGARRENNSLEAFIRQQSEDDD